MSAYISLRLPHMSRVWRKVSTGPTWKIGTYLEAETNDDSTGWLDDEEYNKLDHDRSDEFVMVAYFTQSGRPLRMPGLFLPAEEARSLNLPAEDMIRLHDDDDFVRVAAKRDIIQHKAWHDVHEDASRYLKDELQVERPELFDETGSLIGRNDQEITDEDTSEDDESSSDEDEILPEIPSAVQREDEVSPTRDNNVRSSPVNEQRANSSGMIESSHTSLPTKATAIPTADGDSSFVPTVKSPNENANRSSKRKPSIGDEEVPENVRSRVPKRLKSLPVLSEEDDSEYEEYASKSRSGPKPKQRNARYTSPTRTTRKTSTTERNAGRNDSVIAPNQKLVTFKWYTAHRLCLGIIDKHFKLNGTEMEQVFSEVYEDDVTKAGKEIGSRSWRSNISWQYSEKNKGSKAHLWNPVENELKAAPGSQSEEYKDIFGKVQNAMATLGILSRLSGNTTHQVDFQKTT